MNIKKMLIGTAAGALMLGSITAIALAVGSNGSLETGTNPGVFITLTSPNTSDITDWSVDSGSVDYIGSYWVASNGSRSIDLNGLAAGSVSQALTTVTGATYNVTFDLSGNPDSRPAEDPLFSPSNKVLRASATGAVSQDFSYDTSSKGNSLSDMKWESQSYSFVATGISTVLTFASQIPGAFGPALDNVAIAEILPTPSPSPTPIGLPTNKDQCKKGKWEDFGVFKNQGDCVSFVATGGKNLPANP
ncbi:MAG: choice-of-anchor C family protein [Candidatus Daviesbacteria bacterium]|nr:choice-of-anchor C family protein [Candidatus Daviesbacteria bacterium]